MTNYKDISFYKKTFIHNKVWRGRLCSSMMHWFVLYYIHVCQFVCFKYICLNKLFWTNFSLSWSLWIWFAWYPAVSCFSVSLCQYAVVDSNQVYSSSTQPLRLDITLSSYLSDLEEGPYMCRKRSAIKLCPHNIENTVKENLLSLLSLFHRTFNSSHIFDTYPPTSLLKLLLIPELVPKYLSKVKVMSKYSALHQLDPRKIGAEGQTSLMQLFDGDNR